MICAATVAICIFIPANSGWAIYIPQETAYRASFEADVCLWNESGHSIEFGSDEFSTKAIYAAAPKGLADCRVRPKAKPCVGDPNGECALQY